MMTAVIFLLFLLFFVIDPDVVNGIYFTEALNEVFQQNHRRDPTLTWQYFASSTGFFRNYPGKGRASGYASS